jgi:hypothetical protein
MQMALKVISGKALIVFEYRSLSVTVLNNLDGTVCSVDETSATEKLRTVLDLLNKASAQGILGLNELAEKFALTSKVVNARDPGRGNKAFEEKMLDLVKVSMDKLEQEQADIIKAAKEVRSLIKLAEAYDSKNGDTDPSMDEFLKGIFDIIFTPQYQGFKIDPQTAKNYEQAAQKDIGLFEDFLKSLDPRNRTKQ